MEPVKEQWLNKYEFNVYRIDNEWKEVGGVYIFAGENADKEWVAYYIGMTESLKERLRDHSDWVDATRRGATHVHVMFVVGGTSRARIERQLIDYHRPPLNQR